MGQGQGTSLGDMVGRYETPIPDITKAYIANLQKGMVDMPSFQEMYQSYRDVAQQQTDRAGANITEAMGSQGARYGSDLLRARGGLERDMGKDLRNQASKFLMGLRGEQAGELKDVGSYLASRDVLGMNYLWQDYLRGTSPPPLLGASATQPGQPPAPITY